MTTIVSAGELAQLTAFSIVDTVDPSEILYQRILSARQPFIDSFSAIAERIAMRWAQLDDSRVDKDGKVIEMSDDRKNFVNLLVGTLQQRFRQLFEDMIAYNKLGGMKFKGRVSLSNQLQAIVDELHSLSEGAGQDGVTWSDCFTARRLTLPILVVPGSVIDLLNLVPVAYFDQEKGWTINYISDVNHLINVERTEQVSVHRSQDVINSRDVIIDLSEGDSVRFTGVSFWFHGESDPVDISADELAKLVFGDDPNYLVTIDLIEGPVSIFSANDHFYIEKGELPPNNATGFSRLVQLIEDYLRASEDSEYADVKGQCIPLAIVEVNRYLIKYLLLLKHFGEQHGLDFNDLIAQVEDLPDV